MNKLWDNEDRNRYYGLRVGDLVDCSSSFLKQFQGQGEVVEYGMTDNNAVYVKVESYEEPIHCVAEWLNLVTKVEDRGCI